METEAEEEMMALESIFFDTFTKLDSNRFRIRIDSSSAAEHERNHDIPPFFLEVSLPSSYPQQIPAFDISNINNNPYSDFAKKAIIHGLEEQASMLIGESMCYSILEWLREKLLEFYSMKSAHMDEGDESVVSVPSEYDHKDPSTIKKDAKSKLTKSQKRRYFDRFGAAAEKPRGWDWVSIISHDTSILIERTMLEHTNTDGRSTSNQGTQLATAPPLVAQASPQGVPLTSLPQVRKKQWKRKKPMYVWEMVMGVKALLCILISVLSTYLFFVRLDKF